MVFDKHERIEKVKIGCRDLSRENLARKDFLALMNKLSFQNKDNIFKSIKQVFRDDCLSVYKDITWDMMQRSPELHDLHMHVLDVIATATEQRSRWSEMWKDHGEHFLAARMFCPPEDVLHDEDYDEFCAFVKWKKKTNAGMQALVLMEKKRWIANIIEQLYHVLSICIDKQMKLTDGVGDKIVDAYVEQISILIDAYETQHVRTWLEAHLINAQSIRPATRFKLYDLQEKIDIKLKVSKEKRR